MSRKWSETEDNYLRFNYSNFTNAILSEKMARSASSIKDRAAKLGVNKSGSRKRWSKTEHSYLAKHQGILPPSVIAKKLGRSRAAIENRCTLFFNKNPRCDLVFEELKEAHFNPFLTGKIGGKPNVQSKV